MSAKILNQANFIAKNTVSFSRHLPVEIERAWTAISTKEGLDNWYMEIEIDLRVGGAFSHHWSGTIGELISHKRIRFDNGEDGGSTTFELQKEGEGTLFTLTDSLAEDCVCPFEPGMMSSNQPGGPGTHWVGVVAGWHCFVDSLENYLSPKAQTAEEAFNELVVFYDQYLLDFHAD